MNLFKQQMQKNDNYFLSILDELSGGRNKTPMLQDAGLTKGTISRLINGDPPSIDILTALAHTENASLHWMTERRGAPYRVNRIANDVEGCRLLDELLGEGGWSGYQFTDGAGAICLVLTQPGVYEIKGRSVHYTIVEILAGDIGEKTLERFIRVSAEGLATHTAEISQDEFDRLSSGHMGNYELLGWRDEHGLVHTATPADQQSLYQMGEVRTGYAKTLDDSERRLIGRFRTLTPQAQKQLLQIADTLKR
jgi:hypothetical protein